MRTTVGTVAALVGGQVRGDATRELLGVADLRSAQDTHISFLANKKYRADCESSQAGAILIRPADAESLSQHHAALVLCEDPYFALAKVAEHFHPAPRPQPGIHPQALIAESAVVHPSATVGMGAIVEADAQVGSDTWIGAGAYVGVGARIGEGSVLHPGVRVLYGCTVGDRVVLHAGAVIGSDGFGFAPDSSGRRRKIPQVGSVEIADDVEIGANTTVDRATFGCTRVGAGTKIDNLVQIAHNVETGQDCVIVSQSGIAGSTRLGDRVIMGAQSGIAGHVSIVSDCMFGARAGVASSIDEAGVYSGTPVLPHKQWLRVAVSQAVIPELRRIVRSLEQRLQALEERYSQKTQE